jgi:hypothetical protein
MVADPHLLAEVSLKLFLALDRNGTFAAQDHIM